MVGCHMVWCHMNYDVIGNMKTCIYDGAIMCGKKRAGMVKKENMIISIRSSDAPP